MASMSGKDQVKETDKPSGNLPLNSTSVNGSDPSKRTSEVSETKRSSTSSVNRGAKSPVLGSEHIPKSPDTNVSTASKTPALGSEQAKKTPTDFKFGKVIGEGSFSQVRPCKFFFTVAAFSTVI